MKCYLSGIENVKDKIAQARVSSKTTLTQPNERGYTWPLRSTNAGVHLSGRDRRFARASVVFLFRTLT